jgi:hypothetical protein
MRIQVMCALEFHNDFWQKNYFYFSRIISKEIIIASLFNIKDILNPLSAPSMYSAQGIFQHHFQYKKCALYSIKYSTYLFW